MPWVQPAPVQRQEEVLAVGEEEEDHLHAGRRQLTALMHAVIFGKLDCLKHLIAKGANLQATDNVSAARQPPPANPQPLTPAPHARGEY